ncbi:hypothetical protein PR002_g3259 [Phytophthora rubi]|uniref:Uncharacterized protein n=1 Tax=Phytophthora rubi TaxID=129364 RepID=A0A6A3NPM2_9STRA|nr:hypothetical protein PR002_g3259 [Phytophthora rubi]
MSDLPVEVTAREEETDKKTDAAEEAQETTGAAVETQETTGAAGATQETTTRPGNTHELSDRAEEELKGDFYLWQYCQRTPTKRSHKTQPIQEPTSVKTKTMSRRR